MGLSKRLFQPSSLPGGGRKLPDNERFHLATSNKWIYSQGHLSDLIRLQWLNNEAKPAISWCDENGDDKAAIIAHDYLDFQSGNRHQHISIETTMSPSGQYAGQLFTRMEFPWDADTCEIQTHSSNFTVRSGVCRVTGEDGANKEFRIQRENGTDTGVSRWSIRADNTSETGGNAGSDFRIVRYDDAGTALDAPIFIKRSNAQVGIGTITPTARVDINNTIANEKGLRIRNKFTPASATAPGNQGEIAWDDNYIYVCVAANTWKRTALTSW